MAAALPPLSAGAIERIYQTKDTSLTPVLQIVELKQINANNGTGVTRYRLQISDGVRYQQAMLATQLNNCVAEGALQVNSVVRMRDFICNEVSGKRIIIMLLIDILGNAEGKVGNPVNVDDLAAAPAAAAPAQAAPAAAPPPQSSFGGGGGGGGGGWSGAPVSKKSGISPTGIKPAAGRGGSSSRFRDISSINPYQSGWVIRGRCTHKADVRTYSNAKGEGQLFSFELTDNSGSIRITSFNEVCTQTEPRIKIGGVYIVSKAQLKQANERYNKSTSNFEMTLGRESEVKEDTDDGSVVQIKYNFTKIVDLEKIEVKGACDVVAIVHEIQPLSEITARSTGEQMIKRGITLMDDSGGTVEVTLWRKQAESLLTEEDADRHPVIVLRGASRGDFGGVSLNVSGQTVIEVDPTSVEEANALRGWYDSGGANEMTIQSMSSRPGSMSNKVLGDRKSLEEAELEVVMPAKEAGGQIPAYAARGYVTFIKKDREISYPSDPETKKKLTEAGAPGMWHSEATGREYSDDQIQHRYICNMKVTDFSHSKWMTTFDDAGLVVLARPAGEMRALRESDVSLYESILDDCMFRPIVMKIVAKEDEWNGEVRMKYVVQRAERVNFVAESKVLLDEIRAYGF